MKLRMPMRPVALALVGAVALAAWAMSLFTERVELMRVEVKFSDDQPASITFWSQEEEGHYLVSGDPELLRECAGLDGRIVEVGIDDALWTDMIRLVRVHTLERPTGFSVSSGIVK